MFVRYIAELFSVGAGPAEFRDQKVGSSLELGSQTHITGREEAPIGGSWYFHCSCYKQEIH